MARTVNQTLTINSDITGYDESDHSYYAISSASLGYDGYESTDYASVNLTRGSRATTHIYWEFTLPEIPSAATIDSITCQYKARTSTTSTSYISAATIQLYSGTTAKGSSKSILSTSTSSSSLSSTQIGSWTASEINAGVRLRTDATRGTSRTTSNYYIYFYGATINITYTISGTVYEINASSDVDGITVALTTQEIFQGGNGTITINGTLNEVTVTDNGTDVTNLLVAHSSRSISAVALSLTHSNLDGGTSYASYAVGYSAEEPNSSNGNMYAGSGETGYVDYAFDFSDIPSGATISSIQVKVYGKRENSSTNSSHMAKIGLYSGSTLKSTEQEFTSTSMLTITISNPGTWTRAELLSAKLRFTVAYYGGAVSGITWTVNYESTPYYTYTISNIAADHTIIITTASGEKLYFKPLENWLKATKIYKKISGTWTEVQLNTLTDRKIYFYKGGVGYNNSNAIMNFDGIDSYASRFQDDTSGFEGEWVYPNGVSNNFMRLFDVVADGQSFTFNGTTSYIRPNASAAFDNYLYTTHTIEAYFELSSFDLTSENAFMLYVGRNSKLTVAIYCYYYDNVFNFIKSSGTSSKMLVLPSISLNKKHYIAANSSGWMFDGVYYPDSESDAGTSSVATNDILNVSGQYACASIGMRFKDGKNPDPFNGKLYAMRIHDTILTKNQLLQNMMCDIGRFGL